MPAPWWRAWIIGALLAALAGCSALRLAYDSGPRLAYWWLDRYVDLDAAQDPQVRAAIAEWFAWHRATQLPDVLALLQRAQAGAAGEVAPEQLCRFVAEARELLARGFEHAVPALAALAPTLSDAQIEHVERRFRDVNDDFRDDFLQRDADDRLDAAVKRTVERAEMMYGRLDKAQRERIAHRLRVSPFDAERWDAERRARQTEIMALLTRLHAQPATRAQAEAAVRSVGEHFAQSPRADYRAYEEALIAYNCRFAAELHALATPAQRRHAVARLEGWADDVRALVAHGRH